MDERRVSGGTEAGAHDEAATRVASSRGPASVLPSDTPSEGEEQESQPQAEDGPSRPHGDQLADALPSDDERGADQDPDAAPDAERGRG